MTVPFSQWLALASLLVLGFGASGCSVRSSVLGLEVPASVWSDPTQSAIAEFSAYDDRSLRPEYPGLREAVLEDDPSRGVGLKQANSMGGGEASILTPGRFRVFLFMGQSNMTGHGRAGKLTPPLNEPHPRIRIWAKGQWQYLVPKRNFGPEVSFTHDLIKDLPGETIGIIKVAVAGTGMNAWKPDWEWSAASKTGDALKGSLYRDMIEAVAEAREVSDFQLGGFVWKQGGRDAKKTELAETYRERFIELVGHVRSDLGAPDLPVFVLTYFDEAGIFRHRELLENMRPKALPLYLSKARVSQDIANAFPVFHGLLPTRIDQVHFDTEGQLQLGQLTAGAVRDYLVRVEDLGTQLPSNSGPIVEPPVPEW